MSVIGKHIVMVNAKKDTGSSDDQPPYSGGIVKPLHWPEAKSKRTVADLIVSSRTYLYAKLGPFAAWHVEAIDEAVSNFQRDMPFSVLDVPLSSPVTEGSITALTLKQIAQEHGIPMTTGAPYYDVCDWITTSKRRMETLEQPA